MPARKSKKWQSRRKPSLGQLRRAHPASGATWNVQVVRGKMTSKCLWHACRALILGILLMLMGASMATIGYYADHLSMGHEIRGNATVRVKNESRGFHLNNLSYAGPIVMGFGGFIIVAACVMTFEARDSAAKVVPARFKISTSSRSNIRSNSSSGASNRRANGVMHQATRWDHHLGVFRTSPADPPAAEQPIDRQALTAALIHFSKTLGNSPRQSPKTKRFSLSGSVPNLSSALTSNRSSINSAQLSPLYRRQLINNTITPNSITAKQFIYQQFQLQQQLHHKSKYHHHNHHHKYYHHANDEITCDDAGKTNDNEKNDSSGKGGVGISINNGSNNKNGKRNRNNNITTNFINKERPFSKSRSSRTSTSLINRTSRGSSGCEKNNGSLLHPGKLHQMHRHAISVDESGPYFNTSDIDDASLMSIIMLDSKHEKRIKDRNKRSDTAKRHILSRQKPIEEQQQNHQNAIVALAAAAAARLEERRRSSTASDVSYASRYYRASSATSRTNSIDSRSIQVELHSPEKQHHQQQQHYKMSPRSPRRQSSTPSIDREFRSQLSICSEPGTVIRQLSGQSSLEPCVLEESPETEDRASTDNLENQTSLKYNQNLEKNSLNTISANIQDDLHTPTHRSRTKSTGSSSPIYCNIKKQRPQSLKINMNPVQVIKNKSISANITSKNINNITPKKSTNITKAVKPTETATVKTIDEKMKINPLQRSNSSRAFYRAKPKPLNEYETMNRSAEDSYSVTATTAATNSYFNLYNNYSTNDYNSYQRESKTDDDFYDSIRVIMERRNKILKTESESNSQQQNLKQNEMNDSDQQQKFDIKEIQSTININNENEIINSDNFDKIKNNSKNIVDSIKHDNLNDKETDDPSIISTTITNITNENSISKTITNLYLQPQNLIQPHSSTENTTIATVSSESQLKNKTIESTKLSSSSSQHQKQKTPSLVRENLKLLTECDTTDTISGEPTTKITTDSIDSKDQNKLNTNNRKCNCSSNNKHNNYCNSSNGSNNNNRNCNCDTQNNLKKDSIHNINKSCSPSSPPPLVLPPLSLSSVYLISSASSAIGSIPNFSKSPTNSNTTIIQSNENINIKIENDSVVISGTTPTNTSTTTSYHLSNYNNKKKQTNADDVLIKNSNCTSISSGGNSSGNINYNSKYNINDNNICTFPLDDKVFENDNNDKRIIIKNNYDNLCTKNESNVNKKDIDDNDIDKNDNNSDNKIGIP